MTPNKLTPIARRVPQVLALALALSLGSLAWMQPARGQDPSAANTVPGEVLLLVEDGAEPALLSLGEDDGAALLSLDDEPAALDAGTEAAEALSAYDVEDVSLVAEDVDGASVLTIELADDEETSEVIDALDAIPGVSAQPNYRYRLLGTFPLPNDKHFDLQYYLGPLGNGTNDSGSNVYRAWELLAAAGADALEPVSVAVLDTGIDATHDDLQDNVRLDLAYDAAAKKPGAVSTDHHGTQVTGVIGATANNGVGVAGSAAYVPEIAGEQLVGVIPVNVGVDDGQGGYVSTAAVVSGFDYLEGLMDSGRVTNLKVVNMSFGLYPGQGEMDATDLAMLNAIQDITDKGVLCVAAGGNGDANNHAVTGLLLPSDYEACLSVTSLSEKGANSDFSDYNKAKDISAPGEMIATTDVGGGYAYNAGTSFSAPLTSGVAALVASTNPDLTPAELHEIITSTAQALPSSENSHADQTGSAGALDAGAAVEKALRQAGIYVDPSTVEWPEPEETVAVYRLYDTSTGEHLLTADANEVRTYVSEDPESGWTYEGIAMVAPALGTERLTRLYDLQTGEHLYTTDAREIGELLASGRWVADATAGWYVADSPGVTVWRIYDPSAKPIASHLTTTDENEVRTHVERDGWHKDDVEFYVVAGGDPEAPLP